MLYPFWGKPSEDPADPNTGRFDGYASRGRRFFRMAPLAEAEAAVLPTDWGQVVADPAHIGVAVEFAAAAMEAGKPTIAFFVNDSDDPVALPGATVFRTSLYSSRRRAGEFAQPAWSEDFVELYAGGRLPLRKKPRVPTVGFCGLAPRGARLRRLRPGSPEASLRARALTALQRTRGIRTDFIVRPGFVGGAVEEGRTDPQRMQRVRLEYVENMLGSDYILCARGAGNFSYRFYETLSCGRIPVFVDSDCVLPYEFLIDWPEYAVWVDEADLGEIGDRVLEFHDRLSEREFVDLQRECRRVWERYIRPEGFFENLPWHLVKHTETTLVRPSEPAAAPRRT
jgi:hypothetical protein